MIKERIAGYEIHPAAAVLPIMDDFELDELGADIKKNGQRHPILLDDKGRVVDGRNRLLACVRAEVPPTLAQWQGQGSVVDFIVSENVARRHLTPSQKAMIAAELLPFYEAEAKERQRATLKKGDEQPVRAPGPERELGTAAAHAAKSTGAAERSVKRAKFVAEKDPELAKAVKDGKATLKQAEKKIRRSEQLEQIRAYVPPAGEFPVIVADPAWPYEDELAGSDQARGGLPYPATTIEEICARKIPADLDCVLFLWVTNAHLLDGSAKKVLDAWGFEPKTLLTWKKDRMGLGRYLRNITEHCILAVKGHVKLDLTNETTFLEAPRGAHSAKPDAFYRLVEKLCPVRPLLELDARRAREGWVTSGAEAPAPDKKDEPDPLPLSWWRRANEDSPAHFYGTIQDTGPFVGEVAGATRAICGRDDEKTTPVFRDFKRCKTCAAYVERQVAYHQKRKAIEAKIGAGELVIDDGEPKAPVWAESTRALHDTEEVFALSEFKKRANELSFSIGKLKSGMRARCYAGDKDIDFKLTKHGDVEAHVLKALLGHICSKGVKHKKGAKR